MDNKIHFDTIKGYFKDRFNADIEQKQLENNKSGAVYNVIYKQGTDIAVFSVKGNDKYVCIDSNGDNVLKNNIICYVNAANTSTDEHGLLFSEKDIVLHYDNETVDIEQLIQREKELYPERTSIVLNNYMFKNHFVEEFSSFYVDEVQYVTDEQFDEIRRGEYSDVFIEYNKKKYGHINDGRHGILVISQNGDGILVDTQGSDYARYMAYAPQIKMAIEYMLDMDMEQRAIYEMKMYVPLKVVERDVEYDQYYDTDGSMYFEKIRDTVRGDEAHTEKRGLAEYINDNKVKLKKVYSIKPDVERVDDIMMGVVAIKMTEPLSEGEIDELKEYITGQFANGWGSSFEQNSIYIDGKDVYVHFWNKDEYFIKTEQEMVAEQEQDIGMQDMQGMSGMSGMTHI